MSDAPGRIRLGLIGDNISRSRSPALHRIAGRLGGLDVSYDLFIPRDLGRDFDQVFDDCAAAGLRGVNVTYPYKELAVGRVEIADEGTRRIGAVNTVVFEDGRACGHNTDFSGFVSAYRGARGSRAPGRVAMVGAGGVGKAVAHGLVALGADAIALFDRETERAEALAANLRLTGATVEVAISVDDAAAGADGVINCTPLGMVGYPGTPVPRSLLAGRAWVFDAVYTPVDTQFTRDAAAEGAAVISGYELFFHQGVDAFAIFTGAPPADLVALRAELAAGAQA